MSRASIALTGLAGLVGAAILTGVCLLVSARGWLPVLLTRPIHIWGLFLFLAFFSLAEIPLMVFGLRKLAPGAKYLALLTNTGYVFFGAVYAVPLILLTGQAGAGLALAALSLVRLISVLLFLPDRSRQATQPE